MYEEAMNVLTAPRRLKRECPIPWLLEREGHRLELVGNQLVTQCPLHADSDPSFYVTDEGERGWRWGCWPCGASGDVVDLIRALWPHLTFTEAVSAGMRGAALVKESGWQAPVLEASGVFNAPLAKQLLAQARTGVEQTANNIAAFLWTKQMLIDPEWLVREFDLSTLNGQLLVPVYSAARELVGVKHRRLDGSDHMFAFPGSALGDVLYGEDRAGRPLRFIGEPGPDWPILLCEGESDTWLASWLLKDEPWTVLGLATGAGAPVRPAARLAGRQVHIVFDGDAAGRLGAERWYAELVRHGCSVRTWALPEGSDICSHGDLNFLPRTLG